MTIGPEHEGKYDIVYVDVPWPMWGSKTKDAAAAKHYDLMTMEEICDMPMKSLLRDQKHGAFFIWATCPRMDLAFEAIKAWGLIYRGVSFVWIKTKKDGTPIGAQGVPPTSTKPLTELCLFATTNKRGRPFPLLSSKVKQTVFAPRTKKHSQKPPEVRDRIVQLYGDRPRVELFARETAKGWAGWGNEYPEESAEKPVIDMPWGK